MADILKEILADLPNGIISDAAFEAANIVLYTKDKDFFLDNKGMIRDLVSKFKKRVELRPDPSIALSEEKAKEIIQQTIPAEAKVDNILFDSQRSLVTIEAEKPGLAIGKQGALLRELREKIFWVPTVKRTPAIRSQLIENIRSVLYENSDYRKKFLHKVGHRIYDGWIRGKQHEWIRATYLGSGRQVGRSCILLQTPESRILLDCGIDPARTDQESYPFLEAPEFKIDELDAVIISHAHLDHCGIVPLLFKYGYTGPVYCTAPTRDTMALLQLDFVKLMKNDGKEPIYTSDEVKQMVLHTVTIEYEEVTDVTPDVRVTFYNAGHILGSALTHLHIGNGLHNILYTGDMKFGKTNLLDPAVMKFPRLETLMMESTYGGKDNVLPPEQEQDDLLADIIKRTVERRGKILIPVLGSGRAQEVMILMERLIRTGFMEPVNVYIDGMVWDITAIHTAYPEYLNIHVRKQIFHKDNNPFLAPFFKRIGSGKERQQLLEETEPCVILATSGMLVGGPSVEYFRNLAPSDRNSMVFSCFQAEGSLGKRIQQGEKQFTFRDGKNHEIVEVNIEIFKLEISGHSDRKQLMSFVHKCEPRPRKIILNHGESSRMIDLASSIHKMNRIETICPRNLEAVRIK
ncbi:beta-CASP ribonuclease aCPSF1 [Candidatus Woesearchaeota archaeon]|nr:beta-CASP ribonuclease aCPSF1 [Candidatus Woesearchaeota archaeon]